MMLFAAVMLGLFSVMFFLPLLRFFVVAWNTAVYALEDTRRGVSRFRRALVVFRCAISVIFFTALYAGLVTWTWTMFSQVLV